ncbi:unnamed protein product, partial [Mesorhabditis spiculigera]
MSSWLWPTGYENLPGSESARAYAAAPTMPSRLSEGAKRTVQRHLQSNEFSNRRVPCPPGLQMPKVVPDSPPRQEWVCETTAFSQLRLSDLVDDGHKQKEDISAPQVTMATRPEQPTPRSCFNYSSTQLREIGKTVVSDPEAPISILLRRHALFKDTFKRLVFGKSPSNTTQSCSPVTPLTGFKTNASSADRSLPAASDTQQIIEKARKVRAYFKDMGPEEASYIYYGIRNDPDAFMPGKAWEALARLCKIKYEAARE